MWEQIESGHLWHGEFLNRKKNGELYWESASISPVLNDQGAVTHFVAVKENITERKQVEQALRQSRERFQRALENIPDVVVIYDRDLRIQYINAATRRFMGLPPDAFIGRRSVELWSPEITDAYLPTLRDAFQSGATRWVETDLSFPGQRQCNLRITYVPLTDDEGNVYEVLGITHDLTESKAREREIERLNRLYATLCGLNQSIVQVKSRAELFQEVCRITVAHAGFQVVWVGWHDRETHEVRPVARAGDGADYVDKIKVYSDERPEGRGPVGLCMRSGKPCIVEDFVHDPRATPWREAAIAHGLLSVASLPIQLNGEVRGVFVVYAGEKGVFQDKEVALLEEAAATISFALNHLEQEEKRRRAEDSLREREAQYRAVIETSADGFTMCDVEGRFLETNDAYVRRSGYSRDELLGMRVHDVLAPEQPHDFESLTVQIRRDGSGLFEKLQRSKDGTLWPAEVNVAYWPHAAGRFLSFVRDVHRRNRFEALLHTRLQLSDLASRASFDELLQAVLDSAELYTGSRIGYLHLVDAEAQSLTLQARLTNSIGNKVPEVTGKPIAIDQAGAWADCFHTRTPVIHNEFGGRSQSGLPESSVPIARYLSVPILLHGEVTAILGVGNKTSDYNQDDVEVLKELTSMTMEIVARKQSEARMSLLVTALEASAGAIVISRLDGVIEWANPAFSLLTGYSLEEAIGRTRGDLVGSALQSRELTATLERVQLWVGESGVGNSSMSARTARCIMKR